MTTTFDAKIRSKNGNMDRRIESLRIESRFDLNQIRQSRDNPESRRRTRQSRNVDIQRINER